MFNRQVSYFTCLGVALLLGFSSVNMASAVDCDQLYQTLCFSNGMSRSQLRQSRTKPILFNLEKSLLSKCYEIAAEFKLPAPDVSQPIESTYHHIAGKYGESFAPAKAAILELTLAIEQELTQKIRMSDFMGILRSTQLRVSDDKDLSMRDRAGMLLNLKNTNIVLASDYLKAILDTEDLWSIIDLILTDNAFNVTWKEIDPGLPRPGSLVVVMPGMIAAEIGRGTGEARLDYVLAHETGHSIDYGKFSDVYQPYAKCVQRLSPTPLKEFNEVVADFWGIGYVAEHLKLENLKAIMNSAEVLDYLQGSFEILCGTTGEDQILAAVDPDVHPSGEFRIDMLLGRNPDIRKLLGCAPARDSCVLATPK